MASDPVYPGHGLVTAVQQFWSRVEEARAAESPLSLEGGRAGLLQRIRSAHDLLGAELRGMQLGSLADELYESAWVVAGDGVEVDLGVDVAPLVRRYHDQALSVVYRTEAQATRVAQAINAELVALPRASAGFQGNVVVQPPVDQSQRYRVVRAVGAEGPPLKLKEWCMKEKFAQWSDVRQRRLQAAQIRQGLTVDGREFPREDAAPAEEDTCRGYGVQGSEGWKDTSSEEYKAELEGLLRATRVSDYADLPDSAFEGLVKHVRRYSRAYWIKGAKPTRLKGYVVNWDVNPDVPPLQAQARRKSPALQAVERRHLVREMQYDNLEAVPPEESVEWASPVDIVP